MHRVMVESVKLQLTTGVFRNGKNNYIRPGKYLFLMTNFLFFIVFLLSKRAIARIP